MDGTKRSDGWSWKALTAPAVLAVLLGAAGLLAGLPEIDPQLSLPPLVAL